MSQRDDNAPDPEEATTKPGNGAAPAETETSLELSVEGQLDVLRQQLDHQTSEAHKYQDLYTRECAELQNFKRRMQREKSEALRFATEPLVRDLMAVVDNLERAINHAEGNETSLVEGVKLVLKTLLEVLERHGVKRIDAGAAPFDPTRHEAIAQVDSPDHEPGQVVAQHQCGYLLHDRLLRPAMVTVCGRKTGATVESEPKRD